LEENSSSFEKRQLMNKAEDKGKDQENSKGKDFEDKVDERYGRKK